MARFSGGIRCSPPNNARQGTGLPLPPQDKRACREGVRRSAAMSTPALELPGLTKRYGTFTALQSMDLSIRPGEIFALLGPNGAGKTTMIGSVCGLVKKTAGTIRVFGKD